MDGPEFILKILDHIVPRVPTTDTSEFVQVLSVVSSYSLCFSGQWFLDTSSFLGTTGAIIAAFTSSLSQSHPNPLWVISKLLLIVIYEWRNQIS